jgi:hypothetical protein
MGRAPTSGEPRAAATLGVPLRTRSPPRLPPGFSASQHLPTRRRSSALVQPASPASCALRARPLGDPRSSSHSPKRTPRGRAAQVRDRDEEAIDTDQMPRWRKLRRGLPQDHAGGANLLPETMAAHTRARGANVPAETAAAHTRARRERSRGTLAPSVADHSSRATEPRVLASQPGIRRRRNRGHPRLGVRRAREGTAPKQRARRPCARRLASSGPPR